MLLLGAAASTFIEVTQLVIAGRVMALSEVIANMAGALIGSVVARQVYRGSEH
ncbi:VanZ family protein [Paenarthrobacter ureafaciens]